MKFSREQLYRARQTRDAAERAGYKPEEAAKLIRNPEEELQHGQRRRVTFDKKAIETFVRLLDGEMTDAMPLVTFAAQLRAIERLGRDAELRDDERKKLLLAKNFLEDAFFKGTLTNLQAIPAAAVSFFANRVAKLIETKHVPVAQANAFAFRSRAWEELLANTREYVRANTVDVKGAEDRIVALRKELEELERSWFTGSDAIADAGEQDAHIDRYREEYQKRVRHLLGASALTFEQTFPHTSYRQSLKEAIVQAARGAERIFGGDARAAAVFEQALLQGNETDAFSILHAAGKAFGGGVRYDAQLAKDDGKMLNRAYHDMQQAPSARKPGGKILLECLQLALSGPTGAYRDALHQSRAHARAQGERADAQRSVLHDPKNAERAARRDELQLALHDAKDALAQGREALREYDVAEKELRDALARNPATASLYFVKSYLVAIDQQATTRKGTRVDGGIGEYTFMPGGKGETAGFADAHYRLSDIPVASWIARYQRASLKNTKAQQHDYFVLRSHKEMQEKEAAESIAAERDVLAEYMNTHEREQYYRAEARFFAALHALHEALGDAAAAARDKEMLDTANAQALRAAQRLAEVQESHSDLFQLLESSVAWRETMPRLIGRHLPDLERIDIARRRPDTDTDEHGKVLQTSSYVLRALESAWSSHASLLKEYYQRQSFYREAKNFSYYLEHYQEHARCFAAPEEYRAHLDEMEVVLDKVRHEQGRIIWNIIDNNEKLFPNACMNGALLRPDASEFMQKLLAQ